MKLKSLTYKLTLWYFLDVACTDPGEEVLSRKLNLHQAVKQPGNFCCDNGACIGSGQVCDNVRNCEDNSDERHCDLVRFPQSYDNLLPPTKRLKMPTRKLGPSEGHLANVTANMKILDLLDIDEQQSTFDLYFKLGYINQIVD